MNIQETIRVNSREEEEECMVEGYRSKTEEEAKEAKDRDEIRATVVDHVVNHGLTMAEAG